MRKTTLLLFSFFVLAVVSACSNKDNAGPVDRQISIAPNIGTLTRVTGNQFDAGDEIRVYAYEAGDFSRKVVDGVINRKETTGLWTAALAMLWKDDVTVHDFVAVYPATTLLAAQQPEAITLTDNAVANDLLVANTKSRKLEGGAVPLTFRHVMTRVVVNLAFGINWGGRPVIDKVVLKSSKTGTLDFLTSTAQATGAATDEMVMEKSGDSYVAVTLPQTLAANTDMVVITIDGRDFTFRHTADLPLEPFKSRVINLKMNDNAIILGDITIEDWGNSDTIEGGMAI